MIIITVVDTEDSVCFAEEGLERPLMQKERTLKPNGGAVKVSFRVGLCVV
jgi:hypothetical protein